MDALDEAAEKGLDLVTPSQIERYVRDSANRGHLGSQPLKAATEFLNPSFPNIPRLHPYFPLILSTTIPLLASQVAVHHAA
jgi:hypothetical protein